MIIVAVFLSFVTTDLVAIKRLALGLAASVAGVATLMCLSPVPAIMCLLGERNWWLPTHLDPLLPHVSIG